MEDVGSVAGSKEKNRKSRAMNHNERSQVGLICEDDAALKN